MSDRFTEGTFAYDMGQRPSKPVIVTNPDKGTVGDQDPALKELIMDSPGNQAFPLDYDTRCVEVQYLDLDSPSEKTYTMPEGRIAVPQTEIAFEGGSLAPSHYVMFTVLRDVFAEATREDDDFLRRLIGMCEAVGVPEAVVSAAAATVSDEITAEA